MNTEVQRSLVSDSPWGRKELDMTEQPSTHTQVSAHTPTSQHTHPRLSTHTHISAHRHTHTHTHTETGRRGKGADVGLFSSSSQSH